MNILFICTGNTCRSPMANELFKSFLKSKKIRNIECNSAGISAKKDDPASENAIKALEEVNLDLSNHKAKSIFDVDLNSFDLYVVMNLMHYDILKSMEIPIEKIYILGNEIQDPYNGTVATYKKCRDSIKKALYPLYEYIKKQIGIEK